MNNKLIGRTVGHKKDVLFEISKRLCEKKHWIEQFLEVLSLPCSLFIYALLCYMRIHIVSFDVFVNEFPRTIHIFMFV